MSKKAHSDLPMNWFYLNAYIRYPAAALGSLINMFFNSNTPDLIWIRDNIPIIYFLNFIIQIVDILFITYAFWVGFIKRKMSGYYAIQLVPAFDILISLLFFLFVYALVGIRILNAEIAVTIVGNLIWYIPSIFYFKRRKYLFTTQDADPKPNYAIPTSASSGFQGRQKQSGEKNTQSAPALKRYTVNIYDAKSGYQKKVYSSNQLPKNHEEYLVDGELYAYMDHNLAPPKLRLTTKGLWNQPDLTYANSPSQRKAPLQSPEDTVQKAANAPVWILAVVGVLFIALAACIIAAILQDSARNTATTVPNGSTAITSTPAPAAKKMDITSLINGTEKDVMALLGQPLSMQENATDADKTYHYRQLDYDNLSVFTYSEYPHYVRYINIHDSSYILYGLYIGMPKDDLIRNIDPKLSLSLDYEYDNDPFTDDFVSYQIEDYDHYINVRFQDNIVSEIEYLIPV